MNIGEMLYHERIRELEAALDEMNERQRLEWARAEKAEAERDEAVELLREFADLEHIQEFLARIGKGAGK